MPHDLFFDTMWEQNETQVRVPRDGVGRLVVAFPQLMGLSVNATLRPHLTFLRDLGIPS
jgi:hypothetical protein